MASNEPQHTHGHKKGGASRSTDGCPISGQQSHTGAWIYALVYALILLRVEGCIVKITYVENVVAKGAVCLDGSPPAYHLSPGFGIGVNSWLVHLEGGAWCNNVTTCLHRKTTSLGSSKYMEKLHYFSGILSNNQSLNPDFYNWNRVLVRYCDGSSFTGDVETVDPATYLHYRGARVWLAVMEDLLAKGMSKAENALLSGCSAGGLASMLHCDRFRTLFQMGAKVKCLSDAGFFINMKDIAGREHIKALYGDVVKTHGSAKHLPSLCTSRFEPSMCFFPQYMAQLIETPLFIQNSAYDSWQITHSLVPDDVDSDGAWSDCKLNILQCSSTQLQTIRDFRIEFLNALASLWGSSSRGMFINSCYAHCQTEYQATWFGAKSLTIENITIGEAVGNWFYDRSSCQKIDCPYPCNPSCDSGGINGGFDDWKHRTRVNLSQKIAGLAYMNNIRIRHRHLLTPVASRNLRSLSSLSNSSMQFGRTAQNHDEQRGEMPTIIVQNKPR